MLNKRQIKRIVKDEMNDRFPKAPKQPARVKLNLAPVPKTAF